MSENQVCFQVLDAQLKNLLHCWIVFAVTGTVVLSLAMTVCILILLRRKLIRRLNAREIASKRSNGISLETIVQRNEIQDGEKKSSKRLSDSAVQNNPEATQPFREEAGNLASSLLSSKSNECSLVNVVSGNESSRGSTVFRENQESKTKDIGSLRTSKKPNVKRAKTCCIEQKSETNTEPSSEKDVEEISLKFSKDKKGEQLPKLDENQDEENSENKNVENPTENIKGLPESRLPSVKRSLEDQYSKVTKKSTKTSKKQVKTWKIEEDSTDHHQQPMDGNKLNNTDENDVQKGRTITNDVYLPVIIDRDGKEENVQKTNEHGSESTYSYALPSVDQTSNSFVDHRKSETENDDVVEYDKLFVVRSRTFMQGGSCYDNVTPVTAPVVARSASVKLLFHQAKDELPPPPPVPRLLEDEHSHGNGIYDLVAE